jgi:hypothetical protein
MIILVACTAAAYTKYDVVCIAMLYVCYQLYRLIKLVNHTRDMFTAVALALPEVVVSVQQ